MKDHVYNKILLILFFTMMCSFFKTNCFGDNGERVQERPNEPQCAFDDFLGLVRECTIITQIGSYSDAQSSKILKVLAKDRNLPDKKKITFIDLAFPEPKAYARLKKFAKKNKIHLFFWRVEDAYIEIESTDMLYIDSLRTYYHLSHELRTFSKNVRKYICIPRMYVEDVLEEGEEAEYTGNFSEYHVPLFTNKRGVWTAVRDFLETHPEWEMDSRFLEKNRGLLVLKRTNQFTCPTYHAHKKLSYVMKNKIILCTGPSFGKYQLLKDVVESELDLIPYKKIFVATNDPEILDIRFLHRKPVCQLIENRGHHTDCYKCIVETLTSAAKDPEVDDDDVIIFKHESVFLNDLGLLKRAVNKMLLTGCDMVCREFQNFTTTDVFIIRASAVRKLLKSSPSFSDTSYVVAWCEWTFTTYGTKMIPNVYTLVLTHSPSLDSDCSYWKHTALGFYHRCPRYMDPLAATDCKRMPWWDKRDYDQLFR